jgi:O-antigen ligase
MLERLYSNTQTRNTLLVSLGLLAVILAALGVPLFGFYTILVIVAAIFTALIFIYPYLGFLFLALTIPIEALFILGGEVTATRYLGLVILAVWILQKLLKRESFQPIFTNRLIPIILLVLLLGFVSAFWAISTQDVFPALLRLIRLFLLALIVIDLVNSWDRVVWLYRVLVLSGLIGAALTIQQFLSGQLSASGRAGMNISGNLNNTALILVVIIPMALYLVRGKSSNFWRIIGFTYLATSLIAIALTLSRAAFVLLLIVTIVESWEFLRKRTGLLWIVLAVMVALIVITFVLPVDIIAARLATITPTLSYLIDPQESSNLPGSITTRGYIYRVGLTIFSNHPFLGVGLDNFGISYQEYQYIVPGADRIINFKNNPHSIYIGFLSKLGIVGLLLLISIIYTALQNLQITSKNLNSLSLVNITQPSLILKATFTSILVLFINGFAMTIQYEKLLWICLGLSVSLLFISTHNSPSSSVESIK